jgi:hypothetical protein
MADREDNTKYDFGNEDFATAGRQSAMTQVVPQAGGLLINRSVAEAPSLIQRQE